MNIFAVRHTKEDTWEIYREQSSGKAVAICPTAVDALGVAHALNAYGEWVLLGVMSKPNFTRLEDLNPSEG